MRGPVLEAYTSPALRDLESDRGRVCLDFPVPLTLTVEEESFSLVSYKKCPIQLKDSIFFSLYFCIYHLIITLTLVFHL